MTAGRCASEISYSCCCLNHEPAAHVHSLPPSSSDLLAAALHGVVQCTVLLPGSKTPPRRLMLTLPMHHTSLFIPISNLFRSG